MDWKSSSNATDTWNSTSTTMCNQPDVPASAGCVDVSASAGCVKYIRETLLVRSLNKLLCFVYDVVTLNCFILLVSSHRKH